MQTGPIRNTFKIEVYSCSVSSLESVIWSVLIKLAEVTSSEITNSETKSCCLLQEVKFKRKEIESKENIRDFRETFFI